MQVTDRRANGVDDLSPSEVALWADRVAALEAEVAAEREFRCGRGSGVEDRESTIESLGKAAVWYRTAGGVGVALKVEAAAERAFWWGWGRGVGQ